MDLPDLSAHLIALEQELLQPATRKDTGRLTALLADDFRELGASGRIYTRAAILEALADETPTEMLIVDPLVQRISATVALLTYRALRTGGAQSNRSSLWVLRVQGWQMVFHQGTTLAAD